MVKMGADPSNHTIWGHFEERINPNNNCKQYKLQTNRNRLMQGGGGKNPVWAPIVTQQNTLFCIQS